MVRNIRRLGVGCRDLIIGGEGQWTDFEKEGET